MVGGCVWKMNKRRRVERSEAQCGQHITTYQQRVFESSWCVWKYGNMLRWMCVVES